MKEYQRVIRLLEEAEVVGMPPDPKFFDRLHAKIMSQVEEIEMEPPPLWLRSKQYLQSHWKSWCYPWTPETHFMAKKNMNKSTHITFLKSNRK